MMSKGQPVDLWIMYWNYQVNWRRFISEAAGFMVNHIPNPKFFSSLLRKSHLEPNHEKVPGLFKAGLNLCATFCPLGPSLTIVSSTQHNTVSLVPATKARQNYSELLFHAYLVCEWSPLGSTLLSMYWSRIKSCLWIIVLYIRLTIGMGEEAMQILVLYSHRYQTSVQ